MPAMILDGKKLASEQLADVVAEVATLPRQPTLAVILVGSDPASEAYVRQKRLACETCGIRFDEICYPETVTTTELLLEIARLNHRVDVAGIVVQLPLPPQVETDVVITAIKPEKDVDGFHPMNLGGVCAGIVDAIPPATPAGILALLDAYQIETAGQHIVIVGQSNIVGKPLALMLMGRGATVSACNKLTPDLGAITRQADILISAAGSAGLITAEMVKDGAAVIDVGTVRVGNRLVGDVAFDVVSEVASAITPVPGGVGPMTVAALMQNVVRCARKLPEFQSGN